MDKWICQAVQGPVVLLLATALFAPDARAQQLPEQDPLAWLSENGGGGEREGERERDEIETDRDSFTPATTTTPRGRLIFESAYSFLDNRGVKEAHSFPEALFRYGLADWLELRLGGGYEVGGAASEVSGSVGESEFGEEGERGAKLERESAIFYGAKVRVSRQDGWLPQSAVLLQARTPTSGEPTDTHFFSTYVFGWRLPNRWKLDSAIRYATASEKEDRFSLWAPSVVVKVPVGEKVNVHAEYFSLFSADKADEFTRHYFSPGAHYLLTDNAEVGVRVGWGLNDQSVRFFVNAGVGLRF
jgi:hypothetical protein